MRTLLWRSQALAAAFETFAANVAEQRRLRCLLTKCLKRIQNAHLTRVQRTLSFSSFFYVRSNKYFIARSSYPTILICLLTEADPWQIPLMQNCKRCGGVLDTVLYGKGWSISVSPLIVSRRAAS